MSRRPKSDTSISLFPFLAVLVCTMGALILLLIAMTQKLHRNAVARLAAERAEAALVQAPAPTPPSEPTPPPEPILLPDAPTPVPAPPSGPSAAELRELALQRQREREARRQQSIAEREAALADLEKRWASAVAAARRSRDAAAEAARRAAAERDALLQTVQTVAQTKGGAVKTLNTLVDREAELQQTSVVLEQNAAELARTAHQLRHEIETAKRRQAAGSSPYALVPYDGASGTVRRPIYIECTDVGLRFLPEGETITAADLQGFNEGYNPLLAGTVALLRYWKAHSVASGGEEPEPYVLLLVRPSGSVAYYIARKLLTRLEVPFGYELIDEDWKLEVPDPDPEARKLVKSAVADAISTRDELADALTGTGGGGRGAGRPGATSGSPGDFSEVDPFPAASPGRSRSIRDIPPGGASTTDGLPTPPEELPLGPGGRSRNGNGNGTGGGSGPRIAVTPGQPASGPAFPGSGLGGTGPGGSSLTSDGSSPQSAAGTGAGRAGGTGTGRSPASQTGSGQGAPGEFASLGLGSGTGRNGSGGRPQGLGDNAENGLPEQLNALPGPGDDEDWRTNTVPGGEPGGPLGSDGLPTDPDAEPGRLPTSGQTSPSQAPAAGSKRPNGSRLVTTGPTPGASSTGETGGTSTNNPGTASSSGGSPSGAASGEDSNLSFSRQFGPKPDEYDPAARAEKTFGGGESDSPSSGRGANGDAIKKRWGMTNGRATIGLEKRLEIHCLPNKILVGPNDATIAIDGSETKEQLVRDALTAIEQISIGWGRPPRNFYWIPVVKFVVYPGGNQHYERLQNGLREWGLFSSVEYTVREAPRKSFSGALK